MERMKEKMSKKRIGIIILIITVIVLIICGIVVYFLCKNNEDRQDYRIDLYEHDINVKKPIIYLYPGVKTEVIVKLGNPENVTVSYPEYIDGWKVIANTDGVLIDLNSGRKLYSLYWEGVQNQQVNFDEGFVVKSEDTINFLEEKLSILGLNDFEIEEFIIYWLPELQKNKYNLIRFAPIDEINNNMPLEFSVEPDTLIRILMQYKALDEYIELPEQELRSPERVGFVAVEWGGVQIK